MNERLKELYSDAAIYAFDQRFIPGPVRELQEVITEKFAELIVRECADVCYQHSFAAGGVDTPFGYGYTDCGNDIKRIFGIKE